MNTILLLNIVLGTCKQLVYIDMLYKDNTKGKLDNTKSKLINTKKSTRKKYINNNII